MEQRRRKARLKDGPLFRQSVTYICPPKGPALVLTDNETWLGRASFELSEEGQLRCSRKHACLKITNAVVTLECRGINPIYFVVCHSVNFQASEDTPPSRLYQVKRGEAVELAAGDKFFLVPKECLLTVGIEPGYDGAAFQLSPDAVRSNIHDDRSLADQVCSPKATRLVQESNRSVHTSKTSVGSEGRYVPQHLRWISGGAVDPLNPTQRGTLTAGKSVEGRASSTINDRTVVQGIHADTIRCDLDSRGPAELVVKSNPDAYEAGKQIITRNVSCCTSSRRISELSTKRAKSQADLPSKSVANFQSLPLDGISSGLSMMTCEAYQVSDGEELRCKLSEVVDLTVFESEGNSQAQALSQSAQVGRSMCNHNGTGPVEGMEKVIATVSGYDDLLRARLISLISAIGSSYTGSLTKVNTHVVCWKFRGAKFELAKKLGKKIINHRWFEDCFKVGIRLPEGPYKASGEMSQPLLWDPSSVQRPSSRDCHSLLRSGKNVVEQARAPLVIGGSRPSTYTRIAKPSGQSAASSPRGEIDTLDRGKRHVDLKGAANRFQGRDLGGSKRDCQELRQIRTLTGTGDVPPIDLTPHHTREQQSDEFWNEVIRTIDDRKEQVTELSSQVLSKRNHVTGRTRRLASPVPGSSLRELDPKFHDRRRNAIANEVESATVVPCEILQEAIHSHSFVGDQSRNVHREVDHVSSDPEVFERKEAFTSATMKGKKRRRLVKKSEVTAAVAAGDLPRQMEITVGTIRGITTAAAVAAGDLPSQVESKVGTIRGITTAAAAVATGDLPSQGESTVGTIRGISTAAVAAGDLPSQVESTVGTIRGISTAAAVAAGDLSSQVESKVGTIRGITTAAGAAAGDLPSQVESTVGTIRGISTAAAAAAGDLPSQVESKVGTIRGISTAAVAAGDLPSQVEVGTIRGITNGGQPTLNSGAPLQRVATVDRKDECQQRVGMIEVDSVGKCGEKAGESAPSAEIACVICRSDTKPITEGVLACGHQFCYPCIQRWADEAKSKSPSCPLCKVAFDFITFRRMDKAGEDGNCAVLEERIVRICPQKLQEVRLANRPAWRTEIMCVTCESTDTPESFLICSYCRERACHTFCLDPPRPLGSSWYCRRCFQTQSWMPIRQAY